MGSEIPEWATTEAERVAKEATRDAMRDPLMPYYITVAPHISRALVAAERRGIDRAAIAADATEDVVLAVEAILQLGDTP